MASIKINLLASYVSQIFVAVAGLVVVPAYLRILGPEAYGLVGFFALLLTCFNLLDGGMTALVGRQSARYHAGAYSRADFVALLRSLSFLFFVAALVASAVLVIFAEVVATRWLRLEKLATTDVVLSLQLMGIVAALRWMGGPYRGVVSGAERLVWLSWFNAAIAAARYLVAVPVLLVFGATPEVFFAYQLGVALLELGLLWFAAKQVVGGQEDSPKSGPVFNWQPLKSNLRFSLSVAFASFIWVLLTQADKAAVSHLLPLATYGRFSAAVLLAGGILLMGGPLSAVMVPRLSHLEAAGRGDEFVRVYRGATQFAVVLLGSITAVLACFSETALYFWTGDRALAIEMSAVLALYSIGNGILTVSSMPYYLQTAKGDLRLHIVGNVVYAVTLVPAVIWAATRYGAVGAGWAWVALNALAFAFWLPFVHRRFLPGINRAWYFEDVLRIALPIGLSSFLLSMLLGGGVGRIESLLHLTVAGIATVGIGVSFSRNARQWVLQQVRS